MIIEIQYMIINIYIYIQYTYEWGFFFSWFLSYLSLVLILLKTLVVLFRCCKTWRCPQWVGRWWPGSSSAWKRCRHRKSSVDATAWALRSCTTKPPDLNAMNPSEAWKKVGIFMPIFIVWDQHGTTRGLEVLKVTCVFCPDCASPIRQSGCPLYESRSTTALTS